MNRCAPFVYEVILNWYDDYNGKFCTQRAAGVGSGIDYADAAKQIENYYKEDILEIKNLTFIGEEESGEKTIIPIKLEWIKDFKEEDSLDWYEEIKNEKE